MRQGSTSPNRERSNSPGKAGAGLFGANFPMGIDRNKITEEEINNFLKMTSEKSLQQIARETELLAGESQTGGRMVRGDQKITLREIEDFMKEISSYKTAKVTKKDLREYLSAFPQKGMAGKDASDVKVSKRDVNFLLNGKQDMEATELHNLLANTQIEEFDAVEEAFNLLDVDRQGYLSVDCFKTIFEKLKLGTIEPNEEKIFREVADFDDDGKISLEDFRKILTYNTGEEVEYGDEQEQQQL